MPSPFVRAMVDVLRASDHYRLSAIVEMANLTPKVQEQLTGTTPAAAGHCCSKPSSATCGQQALGCSVRASVPMSRPSTTSNGNLNKVLLAPCAAG